MAKSCLVDYRGFITDVVEPGEEFEVYQGDDSPIKWVTCDDDNVTNLWVSVSYTHLTLPTSDLV